MIYNDKSNDFIQGKKIDFNEEVNILNSNMVMVKNNVNSNQDVPFQQNYDNRIYNNINNINNNLINQHNINIFSNNIDYIKQNNKMASTPYINNQNLDNKFNNNINIKNININMKSLPKTYKCICSKTGCKKKYCACFSMGRYCEGCDCKNCENKPQNENNNNNIINNNIIVNKNNSEKINHSKKVITNPKTKKVICNCTKSNCMKKYCECYKQGLNCNSLCRCIECKNKNYNNNCCNYINNDNINNFYNYALHNNINNNININNNFSQVHDFSTSYIPDTFGKSIDYNNPINFQTEAFCIYIKNDKLKMEERSINLNIVNNNIIIHNNKINNINEINNKELINNNPNDLNETPKFSNKKRLRSKNENSDILKTCPTTNSSNRRKRGVSVVNKNIKKKKLQLN